MEFVTNKFKSGGLHEKACSGNLESCEPSQNLRIDTGKPRKTCVEVAGRRTFRILTSSRQSGICVNILVRNVPVERCESYWHPQVFTENIFVCGLCIMKFMHK